jgi:hypothetical protein
MKPMQPIAIAVALAAALAACSERPQTLEKGRASSAPAWQGAQDPFVAPGWKPGDKTSWEAELQKRAQGQNEYVRMGAQR